MQAPHAISNTVVKVHTTKQYYAFRVCMHTHLYLISTHAMCMGECNNSVCFYVV